MNSKILVSLLVIGLTAVAIGGAMTGAFFSDTETSKDNTFAAGEIDLKINSECHYNGNICKDGKWEGTSPYPVQGTDCDCTWLAMDLTGQPILNFDDVKPGDEGESTISIHVTSNPAWVCAKISGLKNFDNGCNEPEGEVDTTCGNPGETQGELQDYLSFDIWRDFDCENDFDEGTDVILVKGAKATDLVWPVADSKHGEAVQPDKNYCIAVAWSLPAETGNIIQSDSVKADISFYAIQERHNPNFLCIPVPEECGNGKVEGDEECDDGNDINTDSCLNTCEEATCGDGYVQEGVEACDDGNTANGDGCSSTCTIERCGNGVKEGTEECDDGNTDNTDACLNTCVAAACGDGYVYEGVEGCDDGNTANGDGCSSVCIPEICEADVMSVLDRSGSIGGNMPTLKDAAHAFVTALNPRPDYAHMGQTSFADTGNLDLHLTDNKAAIDAAIDALVSSGRTNLYEGLLYANQELADGLHDRTDADSPDYMVVITDGEPNEPANARDVAKAQADAADAAGTKIYVVGVGVTPTNADWLKNNIATDSSYYFDAADFDDLEAILQNIANCNPS